MAGIISNVDSDVQKLRKLKNEIENVKKALMGINIKVDIDIAKGLQSQLTSLLGQYDTLVDKIAAAEGKIMLSTSRINKATEKIVQAQEQVSKPVVIPTQTGNANVQTNTTETASIQAQAKAYDELAAEINKVLGTREENIRKLIEESNAIKLNKNLIKQTEKDYTNSSGVISEKGVRLLEVYNSNLLRHKAALSEIRQVLINEEKLYNASENSMARLSQELSRMRIAYRAMTDEAKSSPFGQELLATIEQADAKIKSLDATIGNHQRNIGNYAKGYNGLNMSIQQIVRELPAATMGLNMFFLAISNNLPILTDEIKRVKAANEELKKSGQTGVPVWKQLVSSLFSWQSAMMIGITVMSMYGGEIIEWVKSIFKGKDVLDEVTESQEEMTKRLEEEQRTRKSAAQSVASLLTEYKKLQKEYEALDGNTQRQNKFIKEHKTEFQKLGVAVNDVTDAENLFVKNETAFITSLQHRAMAAAAMAQMETEYKKVIDRMVEMEDYIAAGGNQESRNMAQNLTDSYIASLLKQKGVINSMQSAYPYIDLIKQGKWQSNRDLQGTGTDWAKEYNAYYQNQLSMLVGAEAADRFNRRTEESQKKIESLTKVVRKESTAAKDSLNEAGLKEYEKEAENQLKQQEQLAEQLLSLRRKNQQDEINLMADGTEKKLAQIDLDYQKELDAIRKQEQEWSKANGGKLTKEQSVQISLSYSQAENKRDKSISDVNKEELEAMNRYLKEYGTFQQKKDAITKEYNDKMAKVTTEGDKKLLQKEMEEALSSVDMDKLKQEINWELIFGDLNKVSKKSLEQVKQQLKTFKNSDEYKNMAVDQKKVIDEALNNIQSTIIDKGGLLGDLPEQLDALRIAQDELKQAQDEYNKSLKSGTDAEKEAALKKKNKAEKNVQNAETNVTRSADKTQKSLITLTDTVTQLGSSSEMSLSQIGNLAAGLVDTFSEAGSKIGGIVGTVFSLLDGIEKQGFDGFVKNVFSSVFGAGASMWNTLTFGGFNKLFGIGGNAKEVQDSINRLTDRNETLQTSIESLTDEIKASKGTKSVAAYRSAYEYQKEQNSNYLNIAREQAGYHNSHKSWQYYMRWSAEDLKWIQQNINKNFTGTSSLWELTPEEMEKLRSNVDIWTKMQNAGKGGYGERVTDKLDDYIEQAGKLEELTDNLYEGLTGMSFDSMYDSFVSSLMDMEKSAEDVADDISKYFMQAMLSNAIGEQFSDKLRAWYDRFGNSMENDGKLDPGEMDKLLNGDGDFMGWNEMVEEAMKLRDELAAATGYDKISQESTSQSASSKGFQAMSQDTGEELNGRFTALQIAGEEIKNQNIIQSQSLNLLTVKADALLSINTETRNIADDTRDLIAQSYLELVQISENTGNSAKYLKDIKADIAAVKKNTAGLAP